MSSLFTQTGEECKYQASKNHDEQGDDYEEDPPWVVYDTQKTHKEHPGEVSKKN